MNNNIENILIGAIHSDSEAVAFLKDNLMNVELFEEILSIVEDEEQCDARLGGAFWISQFNSTIISKYENRLLDLLDEELDSITAHIMMSLAKIKSRKGITYIVQKRITPVLYWEGKALEEYLNETN